MLAAEAVGTVVAVPLGLGIWEILIVVGVLLLLFGAKGAPAMARRLGTGVRELKDSVSEMDPRSVFDAEDEPRKPKSKSTPKPVPAIEAARPEVAPSVVDSVVAPVDAVASDPVVSAGGDAPGPPTH